MWRGKGYEAERFDTKTTNNLLQHKSNVSCSPLLLWFKEPNIEEGAPKERLYIPFVQKLEENILHVYIHLMPTEAKEAKKKERRGETNSFMPGWLLSAHTKSHGAAAAAITPSLPHLLLVILLPCSLRGMFIHNM